MSENGIYHPKWLFFTGIPIVNQWSKSFSRHFQTFFCRPILSLLHDRKELFIQLLWMNLGCLGWIWFDENGRLQLVSSWNKNVKNSWSFLNPTQVGRKTKPATSFCFYPSCSLLSKPSKLPMLVDRI